MIKGYIATIITLSIFCILAAFFLGRMSKTCEECIPADPIIKYIEIKHHEKEIEIKRDFEKKINTIPNATANDLDSIWSDYAERYGKDTFKRL